MPGNLQQRRELGLLREPTYRDLQELAEREYHIEHRPYNLTFFDYNTHFEIPNNQELLRGLEKLAKLFETLKIKTVFSKHSTASKQSTLMETE